MKWIPVSERMPRFSIKMEEGDRASGEVFAWVEDNDDILPGGHVVQAYAVKCKEGRVYWVDPYGDPRGGRDLECVTDWARMEEPRRRCLACGKPPERLFMIHQRRGFCEECWLATVDWIAVTDRLPELTEDFNGGTGRRSEHVLYRLPSGRLSRGWLLGDKAGAHAPRWRPYFKGDPAPTHWAQRPTLTALWAKRSMRDA